MYKEKLKDNYDLINSKAIAEHCRKIAHKFDTEELAVLVYRNQRLSIDEKIVKYEDLITNYPDMEVKEKTNCKHYDSVRTLINNEIYRLKNRKEKLVKKDDNSVYFWVECNISNEECARCYEVIENTFKTFEETINNIQEYIKEYGNIISLKIIKKYFNKEDEDIYAYYEIKNKKIILRDIKQKNDDFHDIDQIYLNIPTPFKRGDILIKKAINKTQNIEDIFVLDDINTWYKNIKKPTNCDSSDMNSYGYYLLKDNTTKFKREIKFDYDLFEYYNEELTGKLRLLKAISSFIKDEMNLELFVNTYDYYKLEEELNAKRLDFICFTDKGLELAGMNNTDIGLCKDTKIYDISSSD